MKKFILVLVMLLAGMAVFGQTVNTSELFRNSPYSSMNPIYHVEDGIPLLLSNIEAGMRKGLSEQDRMVLSVTLFAFELAINSPQSVEPPLDELIPRMLAVITEYKKRYGKLDAFESVMKMVMDGRE